MAKRSFPDSQITLQHGAGGEATRQLVEGLFAPAFANDTLAAMEDAAELNAEGLRLAFTTDTFVVRPRHFPGGCLGSLAVHGTLNDLAVSGADPIGLSAAFILEAGLDTSELRAQTEAMAEAARRAGVAIVAGDTKVVEHGSVDGLYINTSGVGVIRPSADLAPNRVRVGDAVLVSGPIGDHGMTILISRGEIELEADLKTDSRSVLPLTSALLEQLGHGVRWMRDATRGGVATVLNELVSGRSFGVVLEEQSIPVRDAVRGCCELLGLDPLHVANEGQFVAVVDGDQADEAIRTLQRIEGGAEARIIGTVTDEHPARVVGRTSFGARRVIDVLVGDPLPRIC